MSGNLWKWCWDWYGDYASDAQTNPSGPESGIERIRRGGNRVLILTTAGFQIAMTMIRAPQASSMGFVSQGEQNKSSASDEIRVLNRIKD